MLNSIMPADPTQMNQGDVREKLAAARDFIEDRAKAYMAARGYRRAVEERPPVAGR
jgi:hypothetical protein